MMLMFGAASLVLILDRITKHIFFTILSQGQSIKILPNIFHITLVLNKGAAFGVFRGQRTIFILLSILTIALIIFYIGKNRQKGVLLPLALGLILGGAIGNLIDRIRFGYVIDFLDFRIWPVFNIADSALTIGAVILALNILLKRAKN